MAYQYRLISISIDIRLSHLSVYPYSLLKADYHPIILPEIYKKQNNYNTYDSRNTIDKQNICEATFSSPSKIKQFIQNDKVCTT